MTIALSDDVQRLAEQAQHVTDKLRKLRTPNRWNYIQAQIVCDNLLVEIQWLKRDIESFKFLDPDIRGNYEANRVKLETATGSLAYVLDQIDERWEHIQAEPVENKATWAWQHVYTREVHELLLEVWGCLDSLHKIMERLQELKKGNK